jgi:hypothetical protein
MAGGVLSCVAATRVPIAGTALVGAVRASTRPCALRLPVGVCASMPPCLQGPPTAHALNSTRSRTYVVVWTPRHGGKRKVTAREQRMHGCRTSGRSSRTSCARCCGEWWIGRATGCCLWAPPRCPPLSPSEFPYRSAALVGRCFYQPPVLAPVPGQRDTARMGLGHGALNPLLLRPACCTLAPARACTVQ